MGLAKRSNLKSWMRSNQWRVNREMLILPLRLPPPETTPETPERPLSQKHPEAFRHIVWLLQTDINKFSRSLRQPRPRQSKPISKIILQKCLNPVSSTSRPVTNHFFTIKIFTTSPAFSIFQSSNLSRLSAFLVLSPQFLSHSISPQRV